MATVVRVLHELLQKQKNRIQDRRISMQMNDNNNKSCIMDHFSLAGEPRKAGKCCWSVRFCMELTLLSPEDVSMTDKNLLRFYGLFDFASGKSCEYPAVNGTRNSRGVKIGLLYQLWQMPLHKEGSEKLLNDFFSAVFCLPFNETGNICAIYVVRL